MMGDDQHELDAKQLISRTQKGPVHRNVIKLMGRRQKSDHRIRKKAREQGGFCALFLQSHKKQAKQTGRIKNPPKNYSRVWVFT